jgi:molybdopterin/thiamine biosynthesis adenylyltransferase
MQHELRLAGFHFEELKQHLYPGDGKEAIAIALCGRFVNQRASKLLVHRLLLIPHSQCQREVDFIEWPTESIAPLLDRAAKANLAIVKIHSHPGWYDSFSAIDDKSDREFFDSVFGWTLRDDPHGSLIMLPDGSLFGRVILPDLSFEPIMRINVAGDEIMEWPEVSPSDPVEEAAQRTAQLFGDATYRHLKRLRIGVVGCSGTGSPVLEQLCRYTVGQIVCVDDDRVERKNINRILHATIADAKARRQKVIVLKEALDKIGLDTEIVIFPDNLYNSIDAVHTLIDCDVIIGCSDTAEARDLINKICTFYLIPLLDMGIWIESDGKGGINKIEGSVHYIQPGKSSLLTRGVYSIDDVKAEALRRKNPEEYNRLLAEGQKTGYKYIKDVNVDRPAVISLNMQIAAQAVNELLNRIHPYKVNRPNMSAKISVDFTNDLIIPEPESDFKVDGYLKAKVGRGDIRPLLESVELPQSRLT